MSEKIAEIKALQDDPQLQKYSAELNELRKDGVNKIASMQQEILAAKKNKLLDANERRALIADRVRQIEAARQVAAENKVEEKRIEKAAVAHSNEIAKSYIARIVSQQNDEIASLASNYKADVARIKETASQEIQKINAAASDAAQAKADVAARKYEMDSALFDAKARFQNEVSRCKAAKNQAFVDHVQLNRSLRNGKTKFTEDFNLKVRDYVYNFAASKFCCKTGFTLQFLSFLLSALSARLLRGGGAFFLYLTSSPYLSRPQRECSTR